jgi:hypothetical protein
MKTYFNILLVILFFNFSCIHRPQNAIILSGKAENIDFEKYQSYAWLPPDESIQEYAIVAIEDELNKRGFALNTENPDFLVMIHILNNPSEELVRTPLYNHYEYLGPGFYSGPFQSYYFNDQITVPIFSGYGIEQRDYNVGTVIIDIIDRQKMEIIWRGLAEDKRNNPIDVLNDLPVYIAKIFNDFPVSPDLD